ncbi:hypothetical protein QFC21_002941 [Naganishia friedmannii]|uniref:Uncharacterized protein n=1 Tax=Naganishia friedmannii TaxID=89922 RepID=A0ACC2VUJ5_9TREE|nr:hypothetical protein QFC21_002941 [Naganishia friedmannii]
MICVRDPSRSRIDGSLNIFSAQRASPERLFLEEMKTTIGKLEWESGHCLRLENAIQWGVAKPAAVRHHSGLVEGAIDELTEMQAEILVDLDKAQRLAFSVTEYLDQQDETESSRLPNLTSVSPLRLYLRRLDVFRAHVRKSLEEDVVKGLVILGDKSRICNRLEEYDRREAERGHDKPFRALALHGGIEI